MVENCWQSRDEYLFSSWSTRRLNIEQALTKDKDTLTLNTYCALLEKAHLLDTMLVMAPRRMSMWGLEDTTMNSLEFLELLMGEVRTGTK